MIIKTSDFTKKYVRGGVLDKYANVNQFFESKNRPYKDPNALKKHNKALFKFSDNTSFHKEMYNIKNIKAVKYE